MSNPSQLFLLADHIKLSLLERQRAVSLKLDVNPTQESNISRSLESFRDGLESLSQRSSNTEQLTQLRTQYDDLSRQFHGNTSTPVLNDPILTSPNDPTLKDDFQHAQSRTSTDGALKRPVPISGRTGSSKNVRFRDNPLQSGSPEEDAEDEANRAALFRAGRYTDDENGGIAAPPPDPTAQMENQQIHEYHQQIMQQQDDQLDRLGESIGRQRYLGMQISDELEGQIALLDEVESGVDRHQTRLDSAKNRLNRVGRKAKDNWGMTTIIVLVVILILLIVVLK